MSSSRKVKVQARELRTVIPLAEVALRSMRDFVTALLSVVPKSERAELVPHLSETPRRVVKMFLSEFLSGYEQDPKMILLSTGFKDEYDEVVLVRNIQFFSLCAHHLLPFFGRAHVAYLPNGRVVGISKLARLVECFARRLQIQERMTEQIAHALDKALHPQGAACIIEATHLCMGCRGVGQPSAETVTSTLLGDFRTEVSARAELMALIHTRRA